MEGQEARSGTLPQLLYYLVSDACEDAGLRPALVTGAPFLASPSELLGLLVDRHVALMAARRTMAATTGGADATHSSPTTTPTRRGEQVPMLPAAIREHRRVCLLLSELLAPLWPQLSYPSSSSSSSCTTAAGGCNLGVITQLLFDLVQAGHHACAEPLRASLIACMATARATSERLAFQAAVAAIPLAAKAMRTQPVTILQVSAAALARELCIRDARLFSRVTCTELVAWARGARDTTTCPGIVAAVAHFNALSSWIATKILTATTTERNRPTDRNHASSSVGSGGKRSAVNRVNGGDYGGGGDGDGDGGSGGSGSVGGSATVSANGGARECARVLAKVIELLRQLQRARNFNAMMAVLAGINNSAVYRLKHTRALLPGRARAVLRRIGALLSHEHGWRVYRAALASCPRPALPYLGIHLTDATFVHQGNKDYVEDVVAGNTSAAAAAAAAATATAASSEGGGALSRRVNVRKLRRLHAIWSVLADCQATPYTSSTKNNGTAKGSGSVGVGSDGVSAAALTAAQECLGDLEGMDDEQLFALSLQLEAPSSSATTPH